MGVIYKITSPTGRIYIGKTTDIKDRIRKYRTGWTETQILLHKSILKYGWTSHHLEILCEVPNEELGLKEQEMILLYKSYYKHNKKGLNLTLGGEGCLGLIHSDKTKKILSDKAKARKHSEDTKNKISQAGKGRVVSLESRLKSSKSQTGEKNHRYGKGVPVLVYDAQGDFMAEFTTAKNAAKMIGCFGTSVISVCNGRDKSIKGFICKYKLGEDFLKKIDTPNIKRIVRPIVCLYNEFITEYISVREAARELKIPISSINSSLRINNGKPIRTGHIFMYKDLYEQKFQLNNAAS